MIPTLLRDVEALGCAITCEEDKLKLDNAAVLTTEDKERLKEHKAKILEMFEQQEKALNHGWTVYPYGECYEKRIGRDSYVYILLEKSGKWTVWRGTWRERQYAEKEKLVIENVDFEKALEKANNYVNWFRK
jgi:hypothetical protein